MTGLVAKVLEQSLSAHTVEGKALRMALIAKLAHEEIGSAEASTVVAQGVVTDVLLTTAEAAYYLNRKPQTLRIWACTEGGPIRPVRLHGRLGWPVSEIRRYLGVEQMRGSGAAH